MLAIDGSGPIRTSVPRQPDQMVLGGARDGSWLSVEKNFADGLYWECTLAPCRQIPSPDPGTLVSPDIGWGHGIVYRFGNPDSFRVIDAGTRQAISPLILKGGNGTYGAVVDPDRSWVAFGNDRPFPPDTSPSFQVNDLKTGERLVKFAMPYSPVPSASPSGDVILTGDWQTGESSVIDTTTWVLKPSGLAPGEVTASAFSPDGRYLVTASLGGDLTLRHAGTLEPIRRFQGDAGTANSFALLALTFSDDGRYLASAHDGRGRLWDVETGQLIGQPIDSLASSSPSAVPGEHAGFIGATEKWAQYWRFDPGEWPATACRLAGRNMTRAEWDQFGPRDQPYRATCPQWEIEGTT